ncbi:unnamed protein product [Linum trigynum]|uniref:Uncharacterized protein n=1 Tax=Linum trigynum TaxID=586398 RepID=A0AAV2F1P5_9ROSI
MFRVSLSKKKLAAASSIWSLRVSLLPPSHKTSHHHYHDHLKISLSSTETIKPCSPTPSRLATFKLSLMDNHAPPLYVPFIFFYPPSAPTKQQDRFHTLKSSLAQTLTRFYPLAGRLSRSSAADGSSVPVVHCNDEGVPFSSATVDDGHDDSSSMARFLGKPLQLDSLQQFLPFPADFVYSTRALESAPQIAFRATAFPCGGLAIGVCLLHKIVDAATLADFMKLWSAVARSEEKTAAVGDTAYAHNRAATSLLPVRHDDVAAAAEDFVDGKQEGNKILARRFVFDEEAVYALKAKAKSSTVPNPSRTEAVAGFLWQSVMSAAAARAAASPAGPKPTSVVSVAAMMVNLRSRMNEPWPQYSVGNIIWAVPSLYCSDQQQQDIVDDEQQETKMLQELVEKLRASVAKLDKEFMEKVQGGDGRQEYMRNLESGIVTDALKKGSAVVPFIISSTIGLRLYDVDFGWGRPAWVSLAQFVNPTTNMVALLESPAGYGVEVWLTLHEKEMTMLEQESGFVSYAKNNNPVL